MGAEHDTVSVDLPVTYEHDREANAWVVRCPTLDVTTQGESVEDAHEAITEAVALYVKHCILSGLTFSPEAHNELDLRRSHASS